VTTAERVAHDRCSGDCLISPRISQPQSDGECHRSERYEAVLTSVRTRAVGVPSSAGEASAEAHTFVSKKLLKASASSTLSKSRAT
jgi:hypothetical protein